MVDDQDRHKMGECFFWYQLTQVVLVTAVKQLLLLLLLLRCVVIKLQYFGGWRPRGHTPEIRTQPGFLDNAPTTKFHHPMFSRSEVIVLTNKQTNTSTNKQVDAAENIHLTSQCYASEKQLGVIRL